MSHDPTTKRNGNGEEKKVSKLLVNFPGIHRKPVQSLEGKREKRREEKGFSSLYGLKYLLPSNSAERHRIKAAAPLTAPWGCIDSQSASLSVSNQLSNLSPSQIPEKTTHRQKSMDLFVFLKFENLRQNRFPFPIG
ncbi:hypothetical protein CDAR_189531 [Caerostris darwini]|uniref:Uncharacterized protein n=1 Tax=Caerostris darwini TaxID=1538125 RepID=A0AAV4QW48_9ARAC|nr:hypothetical protein CDAR_189531 [Caerostris darwini]